MAKLSRGEQEFVSSFDGDTSAPEARPALVPIGGLRSTQAHQEVDARGVSPPLPLLRAHRALRAMPLGQTLRVLTSHPQTVTEFQALVKFEPGYELVGQQEQEGDYVHLLRKRR